jgi:hypothetical protein
VRAVCVWRTSQGEACVCTYAVAQNDAPINDAPINDAPITDAGRGGRMALSIREQLDASEQLDAAREQVGT